MSNNYFLYARKSTDTEERQVLSIESQLAELKLLAQKEDINIKEIFEEAKTAKEPGRPIFNQMLARIKDGEAQGILAWHPDRLARNSIDGGQIIYLVDKRHIQFLKFPTFWFENTPQGKFMLQIAFGQSKYYIDNLSENVMRGLRQKIRRGEWPTNRPPRGYKIESKKIIIDPATGPHIKKLFESYATGSYTLTDLRALAEQWGIRGPSGKPLHTSNIQDLLKNPFYYGLMKFKGELHQGSHETLITKELHDQVQIAMKRNGKPNKHRKHHFALLGLATCPTCGGSFTAEIQRGHHYYRCTKKMRRPCNEPYVREEVLAKQISEAISNVSLPQTAYDYMVAKYKNEDEESSRIVQTQMAQLETKLKDTQDKLTRLLNMHLEGLIDQGEYRSAKEQLLKKKIDVSEQIGKLARRANFWLERALGFLSAALRAGELAHSKNLESQKDFLKTAGSQHGNAVHALDKIGAGALRAEAPTL